VCSINRPVQRPTPISPGRVDIPQEINAAISTAKQWGALRTALEMPRANRDRMPPISAISPADLQKVKRFPQTLKKRLTRLASKPN
jgi:hypothetical protein